MGKNRIINPILLRIIYEIIINMVKKSNGPYMKSKNGSCTLKGFGRIYLSVSNIVYDTDDDPNIYLSENEIIVYLPE